MALSSIIKLECPTCKKVAIESRRFKFGNQTLISLECGHTASENTIKGTNYDMVSSDGRKMMPYQVQGVKFLEEANASGLLGDEQGLGKTIQVLGLLHLHKPELLPAIIVTKTTVKVQFFHEVVRWMGHPSKAGPLTQIINTSKDKALPGFDIYIITYDLLKTVFDETKDTFSLLPEIKTIILDECQAIKNHLSDRAKAVQTIVKNKNIEHVIGLSGTPIKNNAGEYFTILNLLRPRMFPTFQGYLDVYCDSYYNGYGVKVGGLRDPDGFKAKTENFILRRTKDEVLPDLPKLSRKFYHVELDGRVKKAYTEALKELDDLMYDDEIEEQTRTTSMIAIMSKMRRITGMSKAIECIDFVTEFLMSCDRKLVVFVHHHDVSNLLEVQLSKWCADGGFEKPLMLHAQLNSDNRTSVIEKFKSGNHRVMIASTLAAGEGLNLQFCSDAIMLERQWNPANEEQAEGRFHRFGQTNPVSVTYMICSETIDEYFTELVEVKRGIVSSTLDNKEIAWDQNSLMRELATVLVTKGKSKWKL